MKKLPIVLLCLSLMIPSLGGFASAQEKAKSATDQKQEQQGDADLAPNAVSAVLIDRDTGTILYEKNGHKALPPASITKVMTMLLIMEALDKGEIKLTDKVRTSEYAASMGGSQIFLEPGEEMSVEDMLKGIALASGNDASVAMAEHIAGTEKAFIDKMNARAKQLGMNDTTFLNTNGLPVSGHVSSAHDIALMSRELLKHEGITKYTGLYQDYLRKNSKKPFWLVNTNRLVRFYTGADGLKTGYTSEAKYCLTATAKRGNMRVIAVVMGAPDSKTRNQEVASMMDYAFNQYDSQPLYKENQVIKTVPIEKGKQETVNIVVPYRFSMLVKKGEKADQYQKEINLKADLKAPITKGVKIGEVLIKKDGKTVSSVDLVAANSVEKAGWWELFKRSTRKMFGG
ncbi:D-alanyl-D-alanine carboxypeptidase family protein [Aneurinibacillus aneurinilyticus]|uniref:serine-type D-Ala-D-Ala carboxypeptidase n=1 Tax=Aneurinibacillus aneurinilyticus ATCC 12856 TaxID=649747 RepID=U1WUM1_ANEAE|nr:D-alanyl-D-alanine carboxypeptidase family protein [Aneurinibacillus aneurinilyticus]ERI05943.1 serine-type D-Ala-D-Ala carboxypeptidase [Aneurinibacillus aneurinilyticus ATCC 12856]MED0672717.1 D-alanyl-D-alanine carboxypeptidase [Aneurinibacillus aneurinilyticus]MED0708544.1 D-alanyl-D-alanine carboxypeptidase [Aneurinibacillus aneurinilyticus]MED0721704.1 D-alanyl-D-alanine carboxypeptidase [Aneurinibacillus aneurinilyticus]MED0731828.1 D-alanyl-D-alanine carboxypeptidase [Aneurinibacill